MTTRLSRVHWRPLFITIGNWAFFSMRFYIFTLYYHGDRLPPSQSLVWAVFESRTMKELIQCSHVDIYLQLPWGILLTGKHPTKLWSINSSPNLRLIPGPWRTPMVLSYPITTVPWAVNTSHTGSTHSSHNPNFQSRLLCLAICLTFCKKLRYYA